MPLYDYFCTFCGKTDERFFKIADKPDEYECECGGTKKKAITFGHGGIFREEPTWMSGEGGEQMRECLQDSDRLRAGLDEPIRTRSHYNRHLKEHGIIPKPTSANGNLLEV